MKKRIFLSVISIFALMTTSVSIAADGGILDFLEFAGVQDNTFGYSSDDALAIKDVSTSSIDVESPIIKRGTRDITAYLFNVSTSRANDRPTDYWCFYDISDDISSNGNKFRISLDTNGLRNDAIYYVYATPVDGLTTNGSNGKCTLEDVETLFDNGVLGRESIANGKDPCFKIDGRVYGEGNYCENHTSGNEGGGSSSSTSVYAIRSVSHTYDGNNITLTWESLGADVSVEILLWYESSESYRKIGTVNSEDKTFTFRAVHNGDHLIKFNLEDPYQDIVYTAHYLQTENPEVKPVEPTTDVKPVVVGPKENILMILFGTLILYIVYRVAARKRS